MLYSFDGVLKLADFGLSRQVFPQQRNLTANVVSLWYRAPELLMQRNYSSYSFGIDMWAVGCVFAELLQGSPLIPGKDDEDQITKMMSCLGPPPATLAVNDRFIKPTNDTADLWDRFASLSPEGLTLMTRILEYSWGERCSASQALGSSYFEVHPTPATEMPRFS
eukprot:scaffold3079_cov119-Cylindrotheca_fusiformis.AAC.7